jgi:heme/copper-type cytochrome/quinol oxidase subunit 4
MDSMDQPPKPERPRDDREEEADGERHSSALQKFVGFVMMVLAWLQLLLAVSSGSDAISVPFLLFIAGIVIFVNGTVTSWYKYAIMGAATIVGLAFHYHISSIGAATRWEKAVVVYGTILIVGYFMFVGSKPARRMKTPDPPP